MKDISNVNLDIVWDNNFLPWFNYILGGDEADNSSKRCIICIIALKSMKIFEQEYHISFTYLYLYVFLDPHSLFSISNHLTYFYFFYIFARVLVICTECVRYLYRVYKAYTNLPIVNMVTCFSSFSFFVFFIALGYCLHMHVVIDVYKNMKISLYI